MTNSDAIIEDLLKKIDNLQETITSQNAFIMRMATYRDEREDKWEEVRTERWREFKDLMVTTGFMNSISKWIGDTGRRPPYQAGQPADEKSENLDS